MELFHLFQINLFFFEEKKHIVDPSPLNNEQKKICLPTQHSLSCDLEDMQLENELRNAKNNGNTTNNKNRDKMKTITTYM